jgi:hypothetical protein
VDNPTFAVTWDYRCPFARNAHEHVIAGLRAEAPWRVRFVAFSLSQIHVPEGGTPVWEDPEKAKDLRAMEAGIVVRDRFPEQFLAVHEALFAARHDEGRDLRESDVVADVLTAAGVPADRVLKEIESGEPREVFRREHERSVKEHQVWGVPTFMIDGHAAFVRLMNRPAGDAEVARHTVEGVLDLLAGWPQLNEFKHTSLSI